MQHSPEKRKKEITRVTLWGAVVNLLLTAAKMVAGIVGNSAAMIADAVHSLSDLISDAVVLIMVRIAGKGPDKEHDYGHGKFETLATVVVALLLMGVGGKLMIEGVEKIRFVALGGSIEQPGWIALAAAIVSIVAKEILYQWTAYVGKKENSPVMIANAWHHRSDAFSSVGALAGIGGAMALGGKWTVLDPIVSCIISIFIIVVAMKMMIPAVNELTEASLSDETEQEILNTVHAIHDIDNVHALKTRRSGPNIIIELHVVVDGMMCVQEAHDITIEVENALRQKFGVGTQIAIHVEPSTDAE